MELYLGSQKRTFTQDELQVIVNFAYRIAVAREITDNSDGVDEILDFQYEWFCNLAPYVEKDIAKDAKSIEESM
jgi:hypothetical protein